MLTGVTSLPALVRFKWLGFAAVLSFSPQRLNRQECPSKQRFSLLASLVPSPHCFWRFLGSGSRVVNGSYHWTLGEKNNEDRRK